MKIQCSGCDAAEARFFCCADEAALCVACDESIHAANKLVSNHQRVPLSSSATPLPKCDICQETFGYFICLKDRAVLCRKCDVAIHTMNTRVSGHERFLLTGARAGLEVSSHNLPSTNEKVHTRAVAAHPLMMSSTTTVSSASYPVAEAAISDRDSKAVGNTKREAPKLLLAPGPARSNTSQEDVQRLLVCSGQGPQLIRSQYSLSGSQSIGDISNTSSSNTQNIADGSNISSSNMQQSIGDVGNDSQSCQSSTSAKCGSLLKRMASG